MALRWVRKPVRGAARLALSASLLLLFALGALWCFRGALFDSRKVEVAVPPQHPASLALAPAVEPAQTHGLATSAPATTAQPRVGQPSTVATKTLNYSNVRSAADLMSLADRAEASGGADDQMAALHLLVVCSVFQAQSGRDLAAEFRVHYLDGPDPAAAPAALLPKALLAKQKLGELCGSLKAIELLGKIQRMGNLVKAGGGPSKIVGAVSPSKPRTAEQLQAAAQILGQPSAYPYGVDRVVTDLIRLPLADVAPELSAYDRALVRSMVYRELSGDHDPDSLRNLFACFMAFVCDPAGMAMLPGKVHLNSAAQTTLNAIRTQQWQILGL